MKLSEIYQITQRLINESPEEKFIKTLRGVQLNDIEFIFATDKKVIEDQSLVVKGKKDVYYFPYCPTLRKKLLTIFDSCVTVDE